MRGFEWCLSSPDCLLHSCMNILQSFTWFEYSRQHSNAISLQPLLNIWGPATRRKDVNVTVGSGSDGRLVSVYPTTFAGKLRTELLLFAT